MTLLDRFRAQPRQRHLDPGVRLAFVQEIPIDESEVLAEIAREDTDARVRRAAVAKLMDPAALSLVAANDADGSVREEAVGMLRDIALDAFEGLPQTAALTAVDAMSDPKTLGVVAKTAVREEVAVRALSRISDARALGSIARHAQLEPVRLAAFAALQDPAEILAVAVNGEFKDTAVAAVERLQDRSDLEQVEGRARQKGAVKRARVILRELDERAAAEAAREHALRQQEMEAARLGDEEQRRAAQAERDRLAGEADRQRLEEDARARRADEEAAREREALLETERRRQDEAAQQKAEAERQLQAERAAAEARNQQVKRESLGRLQQLAARFEALAVKTDLTLKAGERALRDLRTALGDVPPLPSRQDFEEIVGRLKAAQAALSPKVQELRDALDWQRWANLGVQEQLCQKMEAVAGLTDPEEIRREVQQLQEQWRAASDAPRPQGDALWRRFRAAHDVAWAKCEAHFAAEAETRAHHLSKKIALCERAEALADSSDWIRTADLIKELQSQWKAIGPVTRGQEKASWERFRAACDRFFTRRQADLADRKKVWAANLAHKESLCQQVEALAESTEWDAAASEIKRLQTDWRAIGPVRKNKSDAIWQRFRAACDHFFSRYAQRHDLARAGHVAAREAICAELEELLADTAELPPGLLDKVRGIERRWQQEIADRGVDRERAAALGARYRTALTSVLERWSGVFAGSEFDAAANQNRMEALVRRIEELAGAAGAAPSGSSDAALSPTVRLAEMLKEALASNTIGGRVDEASRLRAAVEEVRQAQAAWSRIGPVPDDVRRKLTDRFTRACRRITERAAGPGRR